MYPQNYDFGPNPYVFNILCAAEQNLLYRQTIWTGNHLQLTLMSIPPCGEIGLEMHPDHDQFLKIESGYGMVMMGPQENCLCFLREVNKNDAIFVPANTWHNVINTSNTYLKLYSIYGPAQHPPGTIHPTKAISDAHEKS